MKGGRSKASGTCSWGQPFCRASTGSSRGVLLRLMPVLTSRTWSLGQQLPYRVGGGHLVTSLAGPSLAFGSAPAHHQPTSNAPKIAVVWEL